MSDTNKGGKGPSSAVVESTAGFLAGTFGNLVGHPFEIIKTRLQIAQTKVGTSELHTFPSMALHLLRSDRPLPTLYRGLVPNLVGGSVTWALFFANKSAVEQLLVKLKTIPSQAHLTTPPRLNPLDYFVSATVAGAVAQALSHPIWVIKTRMLAEDLHSPGAVRSMSQGVVSVYRKEGLKGFYSGLTMSMLGISQGGIQFAFYDPIKNWYLARHRKTRDGAIGTNESLNVHETLIVSTLAKLLAQAAIYPAQVVRTRLQSRDAEARFGRGVRGVCLNLWREAGIRGFYKGLGVQSLRTLPSTWTTFLVYENAKHYLPRYLSGSQERKL